MSWLTDFIRPKIRSLTQRKEIPEHLWTKCTGCEQTLFRKDLEENQNVCRHCGQHMLWDPLARLQHLFDHGSYHVMPDISVAQDPLRFRDKKRYSERLKEARQKTKRHDAIIVAHGSVHDVPLVAACFDFAFIGGSMGMAVGESLLAAARCAIEKRAVLLTIPASGGARMQEGILSLMQMPRSILAVQMVREAGLPVLTLMTHPTTGGVLASFAAIGDITMAEPKAIIGFTGARVIQETLRQPLPPGFQTSEFQKEHGFVDLIVSRSEMRQTIGSLAQILSNTPRQDGF